MHAFKICKYARRFHILETKYVRHDTRHAYERVDTTEADTDAPKTSGTNDALTHSFVAGREAENCTRPIRNAFVDVAAWVIGKTGIVHIEPKMVQHSCDILCG